jgi:cellulose synthase/poly-beta-1,6-N-acetylglucosamine synthase-like glycosyltransferase
VRKDLLQKPDKIFEEEEIIASILIPVYNEEKVIEGCLNSILKNDFPANMYEVVIINDGSTDDSAQIIEKFIQKHQNYNLHFLSKKNAGKASAQNLGLKQATGRYILITDADAVVEKNWIRKVTEKLKNYDIVIGSHYANNPKTILQKAQNSHFLLRFRYDGVIGIPPNGNNNSFRKEIIDIIGFFDETKTSVTGDFIDKSKKMKLKILYDPDIEVFIHTTSNFKNFLKQKLRWREEGVTTIFHFGYTYGLTILFYISILLSILLKNVIYFPIACVLVYLLSFSLYFAPFIRMLREKKFRSYAKYFIFYQLIEFLVRVILLPYFIYRLIKPRKKPTFTPDRD